MDDYDKLLMISHYSAKFGDHRHCGSQDMMFLVVEEQDLLCSLKHIASHVLTQEISEQRHRYLAVYL